MSAEPMPTMPPSPDWLDLLREYGPKQLRARGAHALANRLERLLGQHLPDLERRLTASAHERRAWEAKADASQLEVRAWRTYAAELEHRRDALHLVLADLLGAVQRRAHVPWWQWRARRLARYDAMRRGLAALQVLAQDEPTAPAVDHPHG